MLKEQGTAFLQGKKVAWSAPSSRYNSRYGGICWIIAVFPSDSHPIHTDWHKGDILDCAFWDGDTLAYSDADRYVTIEIIDE